MTIKDITKTERLVLLMDEISIAKSKLMPEDTGHIHTSISYLESRVEELKKEIDNDLRKVAYAY
mgnify:FL=1|tara:strand:- start:364 stop:555 length:192 start_codon:yes stop_codon:yes gene_type:complete